MTGKGLPRDSENLTYAVFGPGDFDEYASWFADPAMVAALEGAGSHWRESFDDADPAVAVNLAVRDADTLVGMVQVVRDGSVTEATVTLAVNPRRRREGIATAMLRHVFASPQFAAVRRFSALTHTQNTASGALLERAGFVQAYPNPDPNGYLLFALYK